MGETGYLSTSAKEIDCGREAGDTQQCWAGRYDWRFLLKGPRSVVMLAMTALRVSSPEVISGAHLPLYHFLLFSVSFLQI